MPTKITYLDYANPDSVGIAALDINLTERDIYNHPGLLRWLRADTGIPADGSKWYCRKSGLYLSATGSPAATTKTAYNDKHVVSGDGLNYFSASASMGFMPTGGSWTAMIVGNVQNTGISADRYLFKTITSKTGINIEANVATYCADAGRGTGVTLSQGPFLVVGGYDKAAAKLLTQATNKAGATATSGWGDPQLGTIADNTDASIRVPYTITGAHWIDVAELLIFDSLITSDAAMLSTITAYLKARYAFA